MEVHVTPGTAKKLKDLATTSGRAPEDIVEDALAGYLEEVASVRNTLDSRYDDLKSGRVKLIDGEEAFRKLREKERAPTIGRMTDYAFHPDAFADLDEIWEYIAQDNIDAADRVLADIHTVLRTLAVSPHIGHRRPDLTAGPLRFHVVREEYLITYAPDEKSLWVVAVLHGRRNPRILAAIVREREEGTAPL